MPCTELCACELGDKVSCENQSEGHLMSDDESDLGGSEEEEEEHVQNDEWINKVASIGNSNSLFWGLYNCK